MNQELWEALSILVSNNLIPSKPQSTVLMGDATSIWSLSAFSCIFADSYLLGTQEYNFVQTLDDHSSSITAVKFLHSAQQLQMVSCGADKSIIFRQLQSLEDKLLPSEERSTITEDGMHGDGRWKESDSAGKNTPGGSQIQFSRGHNVAGKTTLYDMEVDSGQKHILTACQDRSIRVYNVNTGKHSKSFKGSISEDGSLIKVVLDNSGIYAATSCTDKTLCIYDYYSGECMATMYGHSELVTGLKFTNDCRKLISASGDGCIFVWKVPHDMVVTMHARLSQQAARLGKKLLQSSSISLEKEYLVDPPPELLDPNSSPNDPANYRFTLTQLPFWAKKQMSEHTSPPLSLSNKQRDLPRGRWAQRLDTGEIKVKSVYDNDSVIQMPGNQEKKHDSDGSKDSSIDSGTELRNYMEVRQEGITSKQ
ncbi:unnamed protein product, partial [Timema podura]|nr:unnamed protein product [Timema podura]